MKWLRQPLPEFRMARRLLGRPDEGYPLVIRPWTWAALEEGARAYYREVPPEMPLVMPLEMRRGKTPTFYGLRTAAALDVLIRLPLTALSLSAYRLTARDLSWDAYLDRHDPTSQPPGAP